LNTIFLGDREKIKRVYGGGRLEQVCDLLEVDPIIRTADDWTEADLESVRFIFSTWGMPGLSDEQIARMPNLEVVFYGAGSVQRFARPFPPPRHQALQRMGRQRHPRR
jgi:hypothetical protein